MVTSYRKAVRNGAQLLDTKTHEGTFEFVAPSNWRSLVDLDSFIIDSSADCVLGQVFGDYFRGCRALDLLTLEEKIEYGFQAETWGDYKSLQQAWVDYLRSHA